MKLIKSLKVLNELKSLTRFYMVYII